MKVTEYFTDADSDGGVSDGSSPPLSVDQSDCEGSESQYTDMDTLAPGIDMHSHYLKPSITLHKGVVNFFIGRGRGLKSVH